MKYMTFTSSCSYCALANLLELLKIEPKEVSYEDRDIALEIGLPYIFTYTEEAGFYAGAMNQGGAYFSSFLQSFGYFFKEEQVERENLLSFLKSHPYSILGIKAQEGKHAVIFLGQQNQNLVFLNPHRKGDGQDNQRIISLDTLKTRVEPIVTIGYLEQGEIDSKVDSFLDSISTLEEYRQKFKSFCRTSHPKEELLKQRDFLFRAFVIDLLAMMELLGNLKLASLLKKLQSQVLMLFKEKEAIPFAWIDEALFDECIEEYKMLIYEFVRKRGEERCLK